VGQETGHHRDRQRAGKDLKHVGFCADVGHWKRSGFEPALVLEKYGDKVFSLHFKDLVPNGPNSTKWHDVPWGRGESKAAEMLRILKEKGFRGPIAIEYEHHWHMDTLRECVDWFYAEADKLAK
jgi:sugar phosphate isomerase/epimerase